MAKQDGIIKITGTIDDITFYKMGDQYYARMKSSLTVKRFWKDKAFEGSRNSARAMGVASKLASLLYRTLPKELKGRTVFQKLTGRIKLMIEDGMEPGTITRWFYGEYNGTVILEKVDDIAVIKKPAVIKAFNPAIARFEKNLFAFITRVANKEKQELLALLE